MNRLQTDFLFARPSFLSGVARILDLFGVFDSYNLSRTPEEADARAMYSDWRIVGQDIFDASDTFGTKTDPADHQPSEKDDKQLQLFASR